MTYSNTLHPQVEASATGLPPLLARALTPAPPGAMLPPGPRMNPWHHRYARAVQLTGRLRDLLLGLWQPGAFHLRSDRTPTTIRQRPVPSAGATYSVHTHVVVGPRGFDGLEPGLYVYDHERSRLLKRLRKCEQICSWPEAVATSDDLTLVFTVQPGRSFGRYRHRAWPLWIADTAYAQQAVEFLLATRLKASTGPSEALRQILGVPAAAVVDRWLDHGLAPEIPLLAVSLPPVWRVDRGRQEALVLRRSPDIRAFAPKAIRTPKAGQIAAVSGQSWVRNADRVETWSIPVHSSPGRLAGALWAAHREAASLCYSAALSGSWQIRPVSGIPASDGQWIMHALAMLKPASQTDRQDDAL